jgi:hypothetical protein
MKYRAGHGEEVMSARSSEYCRRARSHLAWLGSPLAGALAHSVAAVDLDRLRREMGANAAAVPAEQRRKAPVLRGALFWAAHQARIRALTNQVRAQWAQTARLNRMGTGASAR